MQSVEQVVLKAGAARLSLLNLGAITQGWWLDETPLILGYDEPDAYLADKNYLGAIVGRVANRIGGAGFTLFGKSVSLDANEGNNVLHGGPAGISNLFWSMERTSEASACLTCVSLAGAGGFPGNVEIALDVSLEERALHYVLCATVDEPTPVSLAQHNYYTLGTMGEVGTAALSLAADETLALGSDQVPTGTRSFVEGTLLDFRRAKQIGTHPIDDFYVFAADRDDTRPVATVVAPSGLAMDVYTDQPGAQVYTAHSLTPPFKPFGAICIEPSGFPNAVNIPTFPNVICTPDRPYVQTLTLRLREVSS